MVQDQEMRETWEKLELQKKSVEGQLLCKKVWEEQILLNKRHKQLKGYIL